MKSKKSAEKKRIVAVDIFCGAAGLSYGLSQAGIEVAGGIDVDPACKYAFEENVRAPFIEADVRHVSGTQVRDLFGSCEIRVLAGCAPCQPFSAYTTKRRAADSRWQLLLEFLRITKEVRPEIVTVENVPRLAKLPVWTTFIRELELCGYSIAWGIVDASDYGVPQRRKRLVLFGSMLGAIEMPRKSGSARPTVRTALATLPPISAGTADSRDPLHVTRALTKKNLERIRASEQSGTWRDWPASMRAACHRTASGRTYPSVYGRMAWDKPSPTITTQFYGFGNGRFGHPVQDRAISLREGALLQSFPKAYRFAPISQRINIRLIGRLIGNAVPPALAKAIGKTIVSHALGGSR